MNVLHICSDYPYTSVYRELLDHFSDKTSHTVYVPMLRGAQVPLEQAPSRVNVVYSQDHTGLDRIFYRKKTQKVVAALERKVDLRGFEIIHGHHLFSGGGAAYQVAQRYGIRYITAVRNTDVNWFLRYAFHLRSFGMRILEGASRVIFISPAHLHTVISRFVPPRLRDSLASKAMVIPNGVSDFWLENRYWRSSPGPGVPIRLLYVGQFTANKNALGLIRAAELLYGRGHPVEVTLIGEGPEKERLQSYASRNTIPIHVEGWVSSRWELRERYRTADVLVLPSFTETFGLVYIEAMSQGLPIVYSSGQGIDGYFRVGEIGYPCKPGRPSSIADAVLAICEGYPKLSNNCTTFSTRFRWVDIAREYESIYRESCV